MKNILTPNILFIVQISSTENEQKIEAQTYIKPKKTLTALSTTNPT